MINFKELIGKLKGNSKTKYIIGGTVITFVIVVVAIVCIVNISSNNKHTGDTEVVLMETTEKETDTKESATKENSEIKTTENETTENETTEKTETVVNPTEVDETTDYNIENSDIQITQDTDSATNSTDLTTHSEQNTTSNEENDYYAKRKAEKQAFKNQMIADGYTVDDNGLYTKNYTFGGYSAIKTTYDNETFYYTVDLGDGHSFGKVDNIAFITSSYLEYYEGFKCSCETVTFTGSFMGIEKTWDRIRIDPLIKPWGCSEDEYITTLKNACFTDLSSVETELREFYKAYSILSSVSSDTEGYSYLYDSIMNGNIRIR